MKQRRIIAVLAMILVLVLAVGLFVACDKNKKPDNPTPQPSKKVDGTKYCLDSIEGGGSTEGGSANAKLDLTLTDDEDHTGDVDWAKYDSVLGEFYKYYTAAKAQTDIDAKYAAMAVAEAKLLQTGTYIPTTSRGGNFAIGKVAPYTAPNTLWGNDADRFHNVLVTDRVITSADRDAVKALYKEYKGTGLYQEKAKAYLTSKGYSFKDTYNKAYNTEPISWDMQGTYQSIDTQAILNLVDNLIEYDGEGRLMSALATTYSVSEDGLTYTFKIRENVMWVDNNGRARYEVTAQNWVYGLKRALDKDAVADGLITGVIKGATAYYEGTDTDFSHVGVKAVDKYTLQYTLEEPSTFFVSRLSYNPYAPFCKEYADSVGDSYGTSPDYILSCGPYIVSNYTAKNKIVFTENPYYWAKESTNIKTLTWLSYEDNDDPTATYTDLYAGIIDGAGLNNTSLALARKEHKDDIYVSGTDATAFGFFVNVDRTAYKNYTGEELASPKSDAQKAVAKAAFANQNFRMALARSIDKTAYNALVVGKDAASYSLNNLYTTGTFVSLGKDVTIDINGTSTKFAKGTYYGAIVQAQLNADMGEYAMKVWDETADGGIGSSSGFDGWFNVAAAKHYFELALAELKAQGVEVSASNPIYVDYPFYEYAYYISRSQALKKAIEEVFEGKVVVNLVPSSKSQGWQTAGYTAKTGDECNYDIYDLSGWGPDYKDPSSFLDTMLPINGAMIKLLGIY